MSQEGPLGGRGGGAPRLSPVPDPRRPGDRVEVDLRRPPVVVPARVLHEMASHAREADPEECCGLVTGDGRERFREVCRCRNEMTALHERDPRRHPRDGTQAFHMNEHDYLAVARQAEAKDERVTAVYHSHVGFGVYFSALDREYAEQELFPFPGADHIVLSLVEGRIQAGLFQRTASGFVGRALIPDGA